MASLPEEIIALLRSAPGLTDRGITDRLRGRHAAQQPVNSACRNLERRGTLSRLQRSDGKIGNFVVQSSEPTIPASHPGPQRRESGRVVCGSIDFNSAEVTTVFVEAVAVLLRNAGRWHDLTVHRSCYFKVPKNNLPREPGWYIICDGSGNPLYVGKADDLDARLNTNNGSLDGFAHSGQAQDPARNFIKVFVTAGVLDCLRVAVFTEKDLAHQLQVATPLSDLDRGNIEKVLGLFRYRVLQKGTASTGTG
jgi:hypothetical protein